MSRTDVLGVGFDNVTKAEAVERALELIDAREGRYVVTPNPEIVMLAKENPALKEALAGADIVLPDGAGIVKGAAILGRPMKEKVPGIDFACGTTLVAEEIFSKIQSGHGHHIDTFGSYELVRFAFNFEDDVTMSCSELEKDYDARVVAVEHDDETILPTLDTILHDGDVAIVCVAREDFGRLSRFIRS